MNPNDFTKYANLIVGSGVRLKRGQRLVIANAPVEMPEIVEALTEEAYRTGAPFVDVQWSSDNLLKIRLRNAPADSFSEYSPWRTRGRLQAAKRGDAFVTFLASDPELLKDENPGHVSELVKSASKRERQFSRMRMSFLMPWTVVAAPTVAWAKRVYPEVDGETAARRVWDDLRAFCRLDEEDPGKAWRAHLESIELRKQTMREKQYRELRYEGPGTELTVGLPSRQVWNGGQAATPEGASFSPNIPTEEVFTMPHRERVDGRVAVTRPVRFGGLIVEDLSLRFEKGAIVEATASQGQQQIDEIIATDSGARRLGEVALVSHDTPIARTGRTFFNGLIDENAASHLALGQAYRDCIEEGGGLSDREFQRAGGNVSSIHLDFMVGSNELDVFGVTAAGKIEAVLKEGRWRL